MAAIVGKMLVVVVATLGRMQSVAESRSEFDTRAKPPLVSSETIDRVRASFLRGQIRALRLEIGFVEERIVRAKKELARELRELGSQPDSVHRRALEQEIREIYAQREARLADRLTAVRTELESLEERLAKRKPLASKVKSPSHPNSTASFQGKSQ